jgi:hypothetical protein
MMMKKIQNRDKMQLYKLNQWNEFREKIIELDDYKCSVCGRTQEEGEVLQVHHLKYVSGRKPWEYETSDCITLCKGCHAAEHGIVMPKYGWTYLGSEDLGDLIGTCDNCQSSLRHIFYIFHENWGTIGVGTRCCDVLTDTHIASNHMETMMRYEGRKQRFVVSKRWKEKNGTFRITQNSFPVVITRHATVYKMNIYHLQSDKEYKDLEAAKEKAFDVIESGELIDYLQKRNVPLPKGCR